MKCLANVFQWEKEKEEENEYWEYISHYLCTLCKYLHLTIACLLLLYFCLFVLMWNHNRVVCLYFLPSVFIAVSYRVYLRGGNCSFKARVGVGGPDHVPFNCIINVNLFTHQCDSECQVKRKKINNSKK